MITIFKSTCFLILSRSFQFSKTRKFEVLSANMVDFKKFDNINVEGEGIETSLISGLVDEVQPIESAHDVFLKVEDIK